VASAQGLWAVERVNSRVKRVGGDVQGIGVNVQDVDERVKGADDRISCPASIPSRRASVWCRSTRAYALAYSLSPWLRQS